MIADLSTDFEGGVYHIRDNEVVNFFELNLASEVLAEDEVDRSLIIL